MSFCCAPSSPPATRLTPQAMPLIVGTYLHPVIPHLNPGFRQLFTYFDIGCPNILFGFQHLIWHVPQPPFIPDTHLEPGDMIISQSVSPDFNFSRCYSQWVSQSRQKRVNANCNILTTRVSKWQFLGKSSLIVGDDQFWGISAHFLGGKRSLFGLSDVWVGFLGYTYKSTKNSWHGSAPPPFLAMPRFSRRL